MDEDLLAQLFSHMRPETAPIIPVVCKRFLEICAALVSCQLPFAQLIQLHPRTADRQVVALANRFTTVIGLSEAALESM